MTACCPEPTLTFAVVGEVDLTQQLYLGGRNEGIVTLATTTGSRFAHTADMAAAYAEISGSTLTLRGRTGAEDMAWTNRVFTNLASQGGWAEIRDLSGGRIVIHVRNPFHAGTLEDVIREDTIPWPMPLPTWRHLLPGELVSLAPGRALETVFEGLQRTLSSAGLTNLSVYAVGRDGFAVVSPLESIRDDGTHLGEHRFRDEPPAPASWRDRIAAALSARPGRQRLMVFIVTTRGLETTNRAPQLDEMRQIARGGDVALRGIGSRKVTTEHRAVVLVYEFRRPNEESPTTFMPNSGVDPVKHLSGAGLWSVDQLRR